MLEVLSMNRNFMACTRDRHPEVSGQHFKMAVIKLAGNTVVEADDSA
jgi:hypothetical protein